MSAPATTEIDTTKAKGKSLVSLLVMVLVGLGITSGLSLGVAMWLYEPPSPASMLKEAFLKLKNKKYQQARSIALKLSAIDYREPGFSGATEFVLGMATFRSVDETYEQQMHSQLNRAIRHLREAERRSVSEEKEPEWAFGLGASLHRVGSPVTARPYLEMAFERYVDGKTESGRMLIETYLMLSDKKLWERGVVLAKEIVQDKELEEIDRDAIKLQHAQLLFLLKQNKQADAILNQVTQSGEGGHGTMVLRAQTAMADGKYSEAIDLLKPVSEDRSARRNYPRQAQYLMGICARELGNHELAITYFEETARNNEKTQEALAASLAAGSLLVDLGRTEEALSSFTRALKTEYRAGEEFRNRWVDLETFHKQIQSAWQKWNDSGLFQQAIELSEMMSPLFPSDVATEFRARSIEAWAVEEQERYDRSSNSAREEMYPEVRRRWVEAGEAFAKLAESRKATQLYPETLWQSAENFARGNDFVRAVEYYEQYIETKPTRTLPLALLRFGDALMQKEDYEKAVVQFQQVIEEFPTNPVSYESQFRAAQCYWELNQLDRAEELWRSILDSPQLTPEAREWRDSLLNLAKLLNRRADISETIDRVESLRDQAARALVEYLDRYPTHPTALQARYLQAKVYQSSAQDLLRRGDTAESQQAKDELQRRSRDHLLKSLATYSDLVKDLQAEQDRDRLDYVGQTIFKNTHFEIGNSMYLLGDYENAISAYTGAVSRYPLQSETLTAYVQMANCYERLGNRPRARSMLVQAKALLEQIPENALVASDSPLDRTSWRDWLDWALEIKN